MGRSTATTFTRKRRSHRPSAWFALLGLGFAVAGIDKTFSVAGYERLFHKLGWTRRQMQAAGAAELAGALLVVTPSQRRLGGVMLLAASAAVLSAELRRGEDRLALPRLAMMGVALTALLPRSRS